MNREIINNMYQQIVDIWNQNDGPLDSYDKEFIEHSCRKIYSLHLHDVFLSCPVNFNGHFYGKFDNKNVQNILLNDISTFEIIYNHHYKIIEKAFVFYKKENATKEIFLDVFEDILVLFPIKLSCPCCNKNFHITNHDNSFLVSNFDGTLNSQMCN
jgi:hypothetical protein